MKKLALLKNLKVENGSAEEKLESLGMNTGNMVFWESLIRLFNPDIVPHWQKDKIKEYERVIITDLIWIRENASYEYLEKIIDECPDTIFIPISVGLQSPTFNPNFSLSEATVRLLKKIEKKAIMGVRGYYTEAILRKHGITNISVIGCPSMYYWNNPNLQIHENKKPAKVSSNFRTFYGELSKIEKHFLSYCATNNMQFVEQTSHDFLPEHAHDIRYYDYVNGWITKNKMIAYDYEEWSNKLAGIDFSFGGRFHGNVIALHNNIKALFLTVDSRTKELTDFFRLPAINMWEFKNNKNLEYYYNLADYTEFNKTYKTLFENFQRFAKNNGLTFNPKAKPLDFISKSPNKNEINTDKKKIQIEPKNYLVDNSIYIKPIIQKNRIEYDIVVNGCWETCFFQNNKFFLEFEQNMESCPASVAIIPILGTVLPLSWLEDATIIVDDIDEDFLNCIDNVKRGYALMLPMFDFKGKIKANKVTKNNVNTSFKKVLCLYSGGVDASATMIRNLKYNPTLLTIWGTDIPLSAAETWNRVYEENQNCAKNFNIPFTSIKSSFRELLNEKHLIQKYAKRINETSNWWHEFQHGIGLISLVAPYAYLNNYVDVKIASSFSAKDEKRALCASIPFVDENVDFAGCSVYHDGFYMSRLDKTRCIVDYATRNNKKLNLRVCWEQLSVRNCCVCEKCLRTIFGIYAVGGNPADFGFDITAEKQTAILNKLKNKQQFNTVFWDELRGCFASQKSKFDGNVIIEEFMKDSSAQSKKINFFKTEIL